MSLPPVSRSPLPQIAPTCLSSAAIQAKKMAAGTQDTVLMQPWVVSWIGDTWSKISTCLKKLWDSLCGCFGTNKPTALFTSTAPLVINPSQHPHHIAHPNKLFAYNQLAQGRSIGGQVTVQKFSLNDPDALRNAPLFAATKPHLAVVAGGFRYDASTPDTVHWTANFADSSLFGFCEGPLLAQDELQVLEHPVLAHVKNALPLEQRRLNLYDAALFQNVPRLGALDTTTPLPSGGTLYGNNFSTASQADILARLQPLTPPTSSNIFAIAAPHIPRALKDQPYQKRDLETLFFTDYNAMLGIKETSSGKKVVVHHGNWGCGAFGNDPTTVYLLMLAATRFAGVDELRMHPMGNQAQLTAAVQLLDRIEQQFPQMTIGQFFDHLAANAAAYGLNYKEGNGT